MKITAKATEVVLTCALVLAIGFVASWSLLPRLLGLEPQVVLSGSMHPALETGGVVVIQPKRASAVKVGDILTYRHPERPASAHILVTHRVVAIDNSSGSPVFRTKGDANDVEDPWQVRSSDVVGTAKWFVPYAGYVSERVRTTAGFVLLIGVPAALLAASEIKNLIQQARGRQPSRSLEKLKP